MKYTCLDTINKTLIITDGVLRFNPVVDKLYMQCDEVIIGNFRRGQKNSYVILVKKFKLVFEKDMPSFESLNTLEDKQEYVLKWLKEFLLNFDDENYLRREGYTEGYYCTDTFYSGIDEIKHILNLDSLENLHVELPYSLDIISNNYTFIEEDFKRL